MFTGEARRDMADQPRITLTGKNGPREPRNSGHIPHPINYSSNKVYGPSTLLTANLVLQSDRKNPLQPKDQQSQLRLGAAEDALAQVAGLGWDSLQYLSLNNHQCHFQAYLRCLNNYYITLRSI